jgi:glycosyltransferase involved in cell wall biosynthesis
MRKQLTNRCAASSLNSRLEGNRTRTKPVILNIGISSEAVCGVRDYGHLLADELSRHGITVHDIWREIRGTGPPTIANWLSAIDQAVARWHPDVIVMHYSVFGYSWRGIPIPSLRTSAHLHQLNIPVVTLLHEFAYPWGRRGLRGLIQAVTQRIALLPLIVVSTELIVTTPERLAWLHKRPWLPRRNTTFLPVFSNIPLVGHGRSDDAPTIIIFGYAADGAQCNAIAEAVAKAATVIDGLSLLLIGGPNGQNPLRKRWSAAARHAGCSLSFTGTLKPELLSAELSSASLAVFLDSAGPTSRKGTLAALLAHGCPTIAFDGPQTWPDLVEAEALVVVPLTTGELENAIVALLKDGSARRLLSERASAYYRDRMRIGKTAESLLTVLVRAVTVQNPTLPTWDHSVSRSD